MQACLSLFICGQELSHLAHSLLQLTHVRQIYYTEVVRRIPVKALTRYQKHLLLMQEIKSELFIIVNIEFLCVDLRENVESSLRLHSTDSRNIVKGLINKVSLLVNPSARLNVLIDTLVAAKCSLHNGLGRNIGAKTHGGEHIDSLYVALRLILGTA